MNIEETHIEHDCRDRRHIIYISTPHYIVEECSVCGIIVKFRWKSWWKRLKSIF
jgi:hypothetical protein